MKQVASLTFVIEVFPEKGIFIVRAANGMPLSIEESSTNVADWLDLSIEEQRRKMELFEKQKISSEDSDIVARS